MVEALLQHTLGLQPRPLRARAGHPDADRPGRRDARTPSRGTTRRVGDAATLTGELYQLIDEGLADPGDRAMPQSADQDRAGRPAPRRRRGRAPPPAGGSGVEDYEQLELPPFMTPVMEELVRPPSDAPVKREAEGAEPQPDGDRPEDQPEERGRGREDADKAMRTTEAQAGQGDARRGRPADELLRRGGRPARDRRGPLRRRRGRRLGLARADRPGRGAPGRARRPRRTRTSASRSSTTTSGTTRSRTTGRPGARSPSTARPAPRRASSRRPSTSSAGSSPRSGATSS